MKKLSFLVALLCTLGIAFLPSCSRFQAKRVSSDESDERALEITDKWVSRDTETSIKKILQQLKSHKGFKRYLAQLGRVPKIFIAEVQNRTSNAYFPIEDLNDELLNEFSSSGDFILIDQGARETILKELKYQQDGMVSAREIKKIGKQGEPTFSFLALFT